MPNFGNKQLNHNQIYSTVYKKSLKINRSIKQTEKVCLLSEQLSYKMGLHVLSHLICPGSLWGRVFRHEEIGAGEGKCLTQGHSAGENKCFYATAPVYDTHDKQSYIISMLFCAKLGKFSELPLSTLSAPPPQEEKTRPTQ